MTQSDPERAHLADAIPAEAAAGAFPQPCDGAIREVNAILDHECRRKINHLRHCPGIEPQCPCSDGTTQEGKCIEAPIPRLAPCISISWGDSKCDCAETDDTEVLCITVCNCYSNVTFRDLTIAHIRVIGPGGKPVQTLPDGTPSVQIHPIGPLCFGNIEPCRDGRGSCVRREVVLITRGAMGGDYQVVLGPVCFSVSFDYATRDCFVLPLCPD